MSYIPRRRIQQQKNKRDLEPDSIIVVREPKKEPYPEGSFAFYDELRIAIIRQAVVDYRTNLHRPNGEKQNEAIKKFLLSPYGQWLSGGMGEYIVERLHSPDLPEKSRQVRFYLRLNQKSFARLLRTNETTISCLENGKITFKKRTFVVERIEKYFEEMERQRGSARHG